jgi:hypothetical protein
MAMALETARAKVWALAMVKASEMETAKAQVRLRVSP